MTPEPHPLLTDVTALLGRSPVPFDELLARLGTHFDCPVGTVHVLGEHGQLHLKAHQGLPPPVLDKVQTIPIGKGMAGIAAERKQPVQVCNLQTDDSGVARPGARMTQMEGSLAAPMLDGDRLRGVLGIAKPSAYEFQSAEIELLLAVGATIARRL